jgi:8-oxo-dGTP diphosphatase
MVVLNAEGKILLGLRKGAHRAGHWSFPGGWLDREDTETAIAAIRETLEETGLVVRKAVQHIWVTEDHPSIQTRTVTLYHITRHGEWEGDPVVMEPNKCEVWRWFDLDDLPSPLFPGLQGAIDLLP